MLNAPEMEARQYDRYTWTPPEGAIELPGFIEGQQENGNGGVTYESHTFWVTFDRPGHRRTNATVWVRHGGGVESLILSHMLAVPLEHLVEGRVINADMTDPNLRAAFKMCWGIFELARCSLGHGAGIATQRIKVAFVEGRLKKRKRPGRDVYKVWIEGADGYDRSL